MDLKADPLTPHTYPTLKIQSEFFFRVDYKGQPAFRRSIAGRCTYCGYSVFPEITPLYLSLARISGRLVVPLRGVRHLRARVLLIEYA